MKKQRDEQLAKVIQFPRHRIVRWPKSMNREEVKKKAKAALRILLELLDVA